MSVNSSVQQMSAGLAAMAAGQIVGGSEATGITHFGTVGWVAAACTAEGTIHVLGGVAGAVPPLVGWAAVTGNVSSPLAWTLWVLAILFVPLSSLTSASILIFVVVGFFHERAVDARPAGPSDEQRARGASFLFGEVRERLIGPAQAEAERLQYCQRRARPPYHVPLAGDPGLG